MPIRRKLANRRPAETFEIDVAGLHYTCSVGRFDDGSVAEVFLNNHRANSAADVNARDAAVVFPIARQYNVPLDVIRAALCRDSQGHAAGPLAAALDVVTSQV